VGGGRGDERGEGWGDGWLALGSEMGGFLWVMAGWCGEGWVLAGLKVVVEVKEGRKHMQTTWRSEGLVVDCVEACRRDSYEAQANGKAGLIEGLTGRGGLSTTFLTTTKAGRGMRLRCAAAGK